MQHNVLCIPLLFLHDYDVKMHNFMFLFLNLDMVLGIQLQLGLPTFDKVSWQE